MGTWVSRGVYGVLGVLALGLVALVGVSVVETALVSNNSTGDASSPGGSSNVADNSSVGDHSTPDGSTGMFINYRASALNSFVDVGCVTPSGGHISGYVNTYQGPDDSYNNAVTFSGAVPVGSTCTVSETIQANYWDFITYTDTDTDPALTVGSTRTLELHEGDNYVTFSHDYEPLQRVPLRVDLTLTGDPAPAASLFRVRWRCDFEGTTTANGLEDFTGTLFALGSQAVGEECQVRVTPLDNFENWSFTPRQNVAVSGNELMKIPFTLDYFDPSLYEPTKLRIKVEVDAPDGMDPSMTFDILCDNGNQGFATIAPYPGAFTDGAAVFSLAPTRPITNCTVHGGFGLPSAVGWDRRVDGVCGSDAHVAISAGTTKTVTFSNTWVEPYVAQCTAQ
jgi:hypothetical protein